MSDATLRVALIDNICDPGRPGRSGHSDIVWNIAKRLQSSGDQVHVVGPYTTEAYPASGIAVHRYKMPPGGGRNVLGYALVVFSAWRTLRIVGEMDVVHATDAFSAGILSVLLGSVPVVFTTSGNVYERIHVGNPPIDLIAALAYKLVSKAAARYCRTIIATSEYMRYWWVCTGASPEKVEFLPLGVDLEMFGAASTGRVSREGKAAFGRLLFVGRLNSENSVDYVIRVAKVLNDKGHQFEMVIVGDGPERQGLTSLAAALNINHLIRWMGRVEFEDLPPLFRSSDVFIFSRLNSATPRVVLQAMASGTPVVAFGYEGLADYVKDGETALLARPGDVEDLAHRTELLLLDPDLRKGVSERASAFVSANLSWDRIATRIRREVYGHLARGRDGSEDQIR